MHYFTIKGDGDFRCRDTLVGLVSAGLTSSCNGSVIAVEA